MTDPTTRRLLFTWSRKEEDKYRVIRALSDASALISTRYRLVLVHGACEDPAKPGIMIGGDGLADAIWLDWTKTWPGLYAPPERHPARNFSDPKARNQHMVDLGADLCVAGADRWASGTGHCARRARAAGIKVVDCGVPTAIKYGPRRAAA